MATVHGDAADLVRYMTLGTVFFFYCPFGGERLARVMDALRPLARVRPLRLCFVDMPPPDLPWLAEDPTPPGGFDPVVLRRTQLHSDTGARAAAFNAATLSQLASNA
ncbi:MAG: hypothetical protein KF795_12825 [Labilithrix sp.]|nr:hypothetical protein [Labilithrix sp.]